MRVTGRGKSKSKTNTPVDSDESGWEDSPPTADSALGRLSQMERLMEKMLRQDILQQLESCQRGSPWMPTAAPGAGLHNVSLSAEGSIRSQYAAGSEFGGMAEEASSALGVHEALDLPAMVSKFAIPSQTGEPLQEQLAASINYLTSHQLQEQVITETAAKYMAPANCASLNVPAVNNSIWGYIGGGIRAQEIKIQKNLKLLTSGILAFTRSVDDGPLSDEQQDVLALMCNAHFEINCFRKGAIRPALNPKFAGLCKASNIQPPNFLFGENLPKQVKDLDEKAKAVGLIKAPSTSKTSQFRAAAPLCIHQQKTVSCHW
ncbi:uncharacterized protein LOC129696329 [Leucoraja erinacea]|uniref:uncharacterized protein LOC129696329 n=1 Tax=Leucoraja erinaceus TaxID=7782 RepID=UPI002457206C|nr:uncharacterized protein LOC129696329 [Leucoraja erinacea]